MSGLLPAQLLGRFHPDLADANVLAPTIRSIADEAVRSRQAPVRSRDLIARNHRFQARAQGLLRAVDPEPSRTILFSYSYAARHLFQCAKRRGWKTVLGQIDPGPKEERIVAGLASDVPKARSGWQPADPDYWRNWREEAKLADRIIVNSEWSRQALLEEGISESKTWIVPLSYAAGADQATFQRSYPERFSPERPLRVLFLGQINLRKGAHVVLEVCRAMRHFQVEFRFVGPEQLSRPKDLCELPNVRWIGPVPRNEVDRHYREADVFLLPTFSDGFALTQLEAQAWGLPVVNTYACADVVIDGVNGRRLAEPTCPTIVEVLTEFLREPALLQKMSARSRIDPRFSPERVASRLEELERELFGVRGIGGKAHGA